MENKLIETKLTKRDVFIAYLRWFGWSQQCYNYERLQAMGFTFALMPAIKKLYKEKEDRIAALKRHMVFFNTENVHFGNAVVGVALAMEEQKANGADVSDDDINAVKLGLMGPLAGVGDSWMQGIVWPIFLSLGAGLAVEGNFAGPFLFLIPYLIQMYVIGWNTFRIGYEQGRRRIANILGDRVFATVIDALSILGMFVVGNMAAQRIGVSLNLNFAVGQTMISIQSFLDSMLPGLLGLGLLGAVYYALSKKRSPILIMIIIFAIGILGGYFGFLNPM